MIDMARIREIGANGLWKQNPALIQLLGLCPTLAVTTTAINGVSLGLATVGVMMIANGAVALLRPLIPQEARLPLFILIIASLVTVVDLLMNAFLHPLYQVLGIFVPLIVTNCIVLARVEAFAAKNPPPYALWDGLAMGFGLVWVLGLIGAIRELVGQGTLLAGIEWFLPSWSPLILSETTHGFLLAALPPGAFVVLGFLVAAHQAITAWQRKRRDRQNIVANPWLSARH